MIDRPGVKLTEIQTIRPLTTRVNRPNVTNIAGSDKIVINGFSRLFASEKINPDKKKVPKSVTPDTVPNIEVKIHNTKVLKNHLAVKTKNCCFME